MLSCLLPDPTVIVFSRVTLDKNSKRIECVAAVKKAITACPVCRQPSALEHSRYQRKLAVLPRACVPVQITLQV